MQENRSAYRLDQEGFLRKSHAVHGDRYDYSKAVYVNQRTKVCIICPVHGEFWQLAKNHMNGQGCPECGKEYARNWQKNNPSSFISRSKKLFNNSYEFPNIEKEYENYHSLITFKCKKCGHSFKKIACYHLALPFGGCRYCYGSQSEKERFLGQYVANLLPNETVYFNDHHLLSGMEIDIYIPSRKLAIEYNGCYWHSEVYRSENYHCGKTEDCEKKGVHLVQIFEDEMTHNEDAVLFKVKSLVGVDTDVVKINVSECEIESMSSVKAKSFINTNSFDKETNASVYLGLIHKGEMVALMGFGHNHEDWVLSSYTTQIDNDVVGGADILFQYFVRKYKPKAVIAFADRRWVTTCQPNFYTSLGFNLEDKILPDYRYIFPKNPTRFHKSMFTKEKLIEKYGLSDQMTVDEMLKGLKVLKVWDSGLLKYVWKPS